jgi:hypothetical protein
MHHFDVEAGVQPPLKENKLFGHIVLPPKKSHTLN